MTIYTIIVTYNGLKWIDFCLGSLRQSSIKTIPIIIDNCSTDGTVLYIRNNYPESIIFVQSKNLGFGQANNIGLRYALENNADYVLLLNQDAAIASNMLELCLAQSDEKSLLSPIHMNGDGTRVDNSFREFSLIKCHDLINDTFSGNVKSYYSCGEICAACWLLPITIIKQIGGFNPLFFHYSEDNNYYHRLVYHQISIRLIPQAKVFHDRGEYGNEITYNKQWLPGNLLLSATNINLTALQRLAKYIHTLWQCYRYKLPKGQYKIGTFLICTIKIIASSFRIRKSRLLEKQQSTTYLN